MNFDLHPSDMTTATPQEWLLDVPYGDFVKR